jgi:hypothetical protein
MPPQQMMMIMIKVNTIYIISIASIEISFINTYQIIDKITKY